MHPLVSWLSGGELDREEDAVLGAPVWSAGQLLRDLELRLGLATVQESVAERVQTFAKRLDALVDTEPFFARSFRVDRHGTALTLLGWRDALIESGWCGEVVAHGGRRLAALGEAERSSSPVVPPGRADRLVRVEEGLRSSRASIYAGLRLLEPRQVWPGRWQRVFAQLEALGTRVLVEELPNPKPLDGTSDLAETQRIFVSEEGRAKTCPWRGDGSIIWLRARTSWELGEGVAGLLRQHERQDPLVVRLGDAAPLEAALALQGLATQGRHTWSSLRSPLQVLPLVMALLFEPRDPYRLLELVTLPQGPFRYAGRTLAKAIEQAPGVGSRAWEAAKQELAKPRDSSTPEQVRQTKRTAEKIKQWLEGPMFDRQAGAPRRDVLSAIDRVAEWARRRPHDETSTPWQALAVAASELATLVQTHPAERMRPHEIEQLVSRVLGGGLGHWVTREEAGRITHVSTAHAVGRSHDLVVVWHAGFDPGLAVRRAPWRHQELEALSRAGVHIGDPELGLAYGAQAWRRVLMNARCTLIVATPESHLCAAQPALPLWDEIVARTGAESEVERVTVRLGDLLGRAKLGAVLQAPAVRVTPLDLPQARERWNVPPALGRALVDSIERLSPSALDILLGCPLRYVLEKVLQIRSSDLTRVPDKVLLYGRLGHRLAEELQTQGVLADPARVAETAEAVLDDLIQKEGGPLLMSGMAAERAQVRIALIRAMKRLSALIGASRLVPVAVEKEVEIDWGTRKLFGYIDLLLQGADGKEAILDLKWGESRYRDALSNGRASQLAVYAQVRRKGTASVTPPAGYFALKLGRGLQLRGGPFHGARELDGPSLEETWTKAERTSEAVFEQLSGGEVVVPGVAMTTLVEMLAVDDEERHFVTDADAACDYCASSAICGRAWRQT